MIDLHLPKFLRGFLLASLSLGFVAAAHAQRAAPGAVVVSAEPAWASGSSKSAPTPQLPFFAVQLNAYIERWHTDVRAEGTRSHTVERQTWVIQQPAALQALGTLRLSFVPDYQRVELHSAAILRGGQRIDVTRQLSFSVSQVEPMLSELQLTGRSVALAQIPDLRVGDRLEWSHSVIGQNPVFGADHLSQHRWQAGTLVLNRQLRVRYPAAQSLNFRLTDGADIAPEEAIDGAWREMRFAAPLLQPSFVDGQVPRGYPVGSLLVLSSYKDWSAVRTWAKDLFEFAPSEAVRKKALEFRQDGAAPLQAVAKAVRFVQDDIRYFSISVGDNSHRPNSPQQTLARRFGDCKDKSVLLVALLTELGVRAESVLVNQTERQYVRRYPPTPGAFDHVVVRFVLDGKTWVVDPTRISDGLSFDAMSPDQVGNFGLVIQAQRSNEDLVPLSPPQPQLAFDIEVNVKATGLEAPAEVEIITRAYGAAAEQLRRLDRLQTPEQRNAALLAAARTLYRQAKAVEGTPIVRDRRDVNQVTVTERYATESLMTKEPQQSAWYAMFGAFRLLEPLAGTQIDKTRRLPLALNAPHTVYRYKVNVQFPPNVIGREDPFNEQIKTPHFSLRLQRAFRGSTFEFEGEMTVLADQVLPADMAKFEAQMKQFLDKPFDAVQLTSRNLIDSADAGKPLAQRLRAEAEQQLKATSQVIEDGKLSGPDLANAYVERADLRATLGQTEAAMADVLQALKLNARSWTALTARAGIATRAKRFAQADADLSRALSISEHPSSVYFERGQVRFLQSKFAEALADFLQAEKTSPDGGSAGFMKAWQGISALRAGVAMPNMGDVGKTWPAAAIRMVWGQQTAAQAIAAAKTPSADETTKNECEAFFYAALMAQHRGDTAAYKAYLQKTVDTGVIDYIEYRLAKILLE